jgi:hypothetical protein
MTKIRANNKEENIPVTNPIRCSVCGKPLLNVYPNTLPGIIFATCLSGHKIRYGSEVPARKAV